eukprot:gene17515-5466_t
MCSHVHLNARQRASPAVYVRQIASTSHSCCRHHPIHRAAPPHHRAVADIIPYTELLQTTRQSPAPPHHRAVADIIPYTELLHRVVADHSPSRSQKFRLRELNPGLLGESQVAFISSCRGPVGIVHMGSRLVEWLNGSASDFMASARLSGLVA